MDKTIAKYADKKILIWGYGREGKSTESFFKKHPVANCVDISEAAPDEIDISGYDYVFKSPGIKLAYPTLEGYAGLERTDGITGLGIDSAHSVDTADKNLGIREFKKITSQTELFLEAFRDRVTGITGTKGKSTTTALLHHVLKTCLAPANTAYLVGNIGVPCLDYFDEMAESEAIAVFELSCHQLAYSHVSPHIAIFLNLYEDHLDFYGDRETYFQAKRHITEFQTENDHLYYGVDVPGLSPTDMGSYADVPGGVTGQPVFSTGRPSKAAKIRVSDRFDDDRLMLPGDHNRYNAEFVYLVATKEYGVDPEAAADAICGFGGLPHRLKYIATVEGVRYYDDSICTIPEASIQAAKSIPDAGTILIGGMDRGIDYDILTEYIIKHPEINYICMYASGQRVYDETERLFLSEKNSDAGEEKPVRDGKRSVTGQQAVHSDIVKNMYYADDLKKA
ncbi:MAG: hypothetical protein J6P16_02505, partial [Eubacterium sp.]|nr:hypothetical protein [Eubacterium sp.]